MSSTPRRALHLLNTPPFTTPTHNLTRSEKAKLAYDRARATVQAYGKFRQKILLSTILTRHGPALTMDDVLTLSPKFWELHQDPLMAMDGGAMTLATIQVNLTSGTIARQAVHRPELIPIVEDLLSYRKQYVSPWMLTARSSTVFNFCSGQFLMTEVGHGLDIANLETTAHLLPSGEFILNTPTPSAAK